MEAKERFIVMNHIYLDLAVWHRIRELLDGPFSCWVRRNTKMDNLLALMMNNNQDIYYVNQSGEEIGAHSSG